MLTAAGSDLGIIGGFFEPKSLEAVLSELAKLMVQTGNQFRFFEEKTPVDYQMWLEYLTAQADWSEFFFGHKIDRSNIAEIQALIDEITARGGLPT